MLGHRCTVHPFAVVGGDPQDLKWKGEQVSLKCGDDNSFREHSSVHRGTVQGGGVTTLGNRNLIMAGAMWDTTVTLDRCASLPTT